MLLDSLVMDIPNFNVELDASDVLDKKPMFSELIKHIRPTWAHDDIVTKLLSGGLLNNVIKCSTKVTNRGDGGPLVVRIFGSYCRTLVQDPTHQVTYMKLAQETGCGPEVVAAFTNGVMYTYTEGQTSDPKLPTYPTNNVAVELAKFHSLGYPASLPTPFKAKVIEDIEWYLSALPEDLKTIRKCSNLKSTDLFPTKTSLQQELDYLLLEIVEKYPSDIVFSHCDLWWPNIILSEEGNVRFIDLDLAGMNFRVYDIVRFLIAADAEQCPPRFIKITKDTSKTFLEAYVKAANRECTDLNSEVDELYKLCKAYEPVVFLWFLVACFALLNGPNPPEVMYGASLGNANAYLSSKKELEELKQR